MTSYKMDLHLHSHHLDKKLDFYMVGDFKFKDEDFTLLGFKDNIAVVGKNPEPIVIKANITKSVEFTPTVPPGRKRIITKLKIDQAGDKYIQLNGQKLKVVPQGKIPEEVRKHTMLLKHQMINIGSLNNPLKVRVISKAEQINSVEKFKIIKPKADSSDKVLVSTTNKDNSLNSSIGTFQTNKTLKLISPKNATKTLSNEISFHNEFEFDRTICVIPKQFNKLFPIQPDLSLELAPQLKPRTKLLCPEVLETLNQVKMQALNLSKKKLDEDAVLEGVQKPSVAVTDAEIQTDSTMFSEKYIQTDAIDPFSDLDLLQFLDEGDSPVLNNVSLGVGPSMGKVNMNINNSAFDSRSKLHIMGVPMKIGFGGKIAAVNEDKMKKKIMFFRDLREALLPNLNGNLSIHEGVMNNDISLVKRMCTALKARNAGVDVENHNGCTPLQLAVIHNAHVDIVQTLLDSEANIAEADGEGNNILHMGARFERKDILNVILFHHSFRTKYFTCIDSFNFEGLTPLMICCMSSWTEGAILFVQHGASVNDRDQTSGRTALFHAAEVHNGDIVRLLLDHKADPKIKNFFGTSPHDAMYELEEMPEIIKYLIFGKTKKRSIEAEMNPTKTAKAAKCLKTFSKLKKIEPREGVIMAVPAPPIRISPHGK